MSFSSVILLAIGIIYFSRALNYQAGIQGEKAVVDALRELDDSYYLINDILAGSKGGNIDHVLIGPKGIFVIETKNYSGYIRCNGDQWSKEGAQRSYKIKSVSKQARNNAAYLGNLIRTRTNLNVFVYPICVFTNNLSQLKVYRATMPILRLVDLTKFIRDLPSSTALLNTQIEKICQSILGDITDEATNDPDIIGSR